MFLIKNKNTGCYLQVEKEVPTGAMYPANIERASKFRKKERAKYYLSKRKYPENWEIIEVCK